MVELLNNGWNYISEGNAHIVLQLTNTDNVLRLIKEDGKSTPFIDIENSTKFVNLVMVPLLLGKLDSHQEIIMLSEEVLLQLVKELHHLRPENRRYKSILSPFAIKTINLSTLSSHCDTNYCVEIKPKEGFLAPSLTNLSRCYYCLKQFLKQDLHQIVEKSEYCPLNLFSGERNRMKLALKNLIYNPQNNFKLFKDGKLIYHEHSTTRELNDIFKSMTMFKSINIFLDFLIEILLSHDNQSCTDLKETPEPQSKSSSNTCLESNHYEKFENYTCIPFIYKLLCVQKMSQSKDINLKNIGHSKEYVGELIDLIIKGDLNLNSEVDRKKFLRDASWLHLSMISAVAKDCSIMISFSPQHVENYPYISIEGLKISYRVSLTDLEPKNVESLLRREKTESQMIESYKKHLKNELEDILQLIQPHTETRTKQLEAWQHLITEYFKANKLSTLDIREALNYPLFNNAAINRKLSQESLLIVLEDMSRSGRAAPLDKSKAVWEVYWHSLDEWGNMVYSWASNNGMNNSVCTLFELREGDNTADEEFHGLDMNILTKALKSLEAKGKCELIEFDDHQGVKFF